MLYYMNLYWKAYLVKLEFNIYNIQKMRIIKQKKINIKKYKNNKKKIIMFQNLKLMKKNLEKEYKKIYLNYIQQQTNHKIDHFQKKKNNLERKYHLHSILQNVQIKNTVLFSNICQKLKKI